MNCTMCGRSMSKAALTINSGMGLQSFGPQCARRVQIVPTRTRWLRWEASSRKAPAVDPRQLPLWGVAA